jgi:predicted amidohydrolase YtcJ
MADHVFTNGNIITLDSRFPDPAAVLVRDDRIISVGTIDRITSAAGADAVLHDLGGQTLIPGFNDNHIHAVQLGLNQTAPDLADLNPEQIVECLDEYRAANPEEPFLIGHGWDYTFCPAPHRDILDVHFPDLPVFLFQFSGHGMWTNTAGFEFMGLDKPRKNRKEEVMTDDAGSPTGIVREAGSNPRLRRQFRKQMTDPELIRGGLLRALPDLARAGITSVQDNTWIKRPIAVLRDLRERGELTCRFSCWPLGEVPLLGAWVSTAAFDHDWYHLGPRKYFIDGAFSSHTAWLAGEYSDEPGNYGSGRSAHEIAKKLLPNVRRRRQTAHHAIGDQAIAEFCDALEQLQKRYPRVRDLRMRIEHAQLIRPRDIPRLKSSGVVVCAQPPALIDPEKDIRILGPDRALTAYPYRSLLDAGVHVSFGSDYPGEAFFGPLRGIQLVVNREGPESITAGEALECYTLGSAYAEMREDSKGSISPGKLADLVVLSDDILSVPSDQIGSIKVVQTIVGGRSVYQSEAAQN